MDPETVVSILAIVIVIYNVYSRYKPTNDIMVLHRRDNVIQASDLFRAGRPK